MNAQFNETVPEIRRNLTNKLCCLAGKFAIHTRIILFDHTHMETIYRDYDAEPELRLYQLI